VVFARLDGNPEIRAQESSAKLGHELLARVAGVPEPLAAEVT
jgi:hypothetical protein